VVLEVEVKEMGSLQPDSFQQPFRTYHRFPQHHLQHTKRVGLGEGAQDSFHHGDIVMQRIKVQLAGGRHAGGKPFQFLVGRCHHKLVLGDDIHRALAEFHSRKVKLRSGSKAILSLSSA